MQLPDNVVVHEPKVRWQGLWPLTVESSDQEKCSSTQRLWHRMLRWRVYPSLLYECYLSLHFNLTILCVSVGCNDFLADWGIFSLSLQLSLASLDLELDVWVSHKKRPSMCENPWGRSTSHDATTGVRCGDQVQNGVLWPWTVAVPWCWHLYLPSFLRNFVGACINNGPKRGSASCFSSGN